MKKIYQLIFALAFVSQMAMHAQTPGGVSANLQLWLKADAGVTLSGTKVSQWNDQSGNARHHTQATAANQPTYATTADNKLFNHQPTLRFLRTATEWLDSGNYSAALQTNAVYMFVVSRLETGTGNGGATWHTPYSFNGDLFHPHWFDKTTGFRRGVANIDVPEKVGVNYAINSYILTNSGILATTPAPRIMWNGTTTTFGRATYTVANNTFAVGRDRNGTDYMNGDVAEVIIYTGTSAAGDINATDLAKIQSYLSVKYGISLDPNATTGQSNYVSSAGTTYWTGASNTGYQNNIFGLGLDTGSALNQKQATSYPDGAITLYQETLQPLNKDNIAVIASTDSFLMLGDNNLNGKTAYNQPIGTVFQNASTSFLINNKSNRIWKSQTTTIGTWTTNIKLNKFGQGNYVLVSSSNTFAPATTRIYAVVNGVANNVSISNGEFVAIASNYKAPAGLATGLQYWYDGGLGVNGSATEVTGWTDRWNDFTIDKTGTGSTSIASVVSDARTNFNNAVNFTADVHFNGVIAPATLGRLHTTFAVAERTAVINGTYNHAFRFGSGPGTTVLHRYGLGINNTAGNASLHYFNSGGAIERISTQAFGNGVPGLIGGRINNISGTAGTNGRDISFNGKALSFTDAISADHYDNMQIGGAVYGLNGRIPEVIYYNTALSNTDRQKVDSYLAIKYGLTMVQPMDYLAANGSAVWLSTANATHNFNIFGVATDGALEQRISHSVNATSTLKVATIKDFSALNNDVNRTIVPEGSYQMFGDNNAAAGQTALSITCPALSNGMLRINRQWTTQTTGTPGNMWLEVDMAGTTMNSEISLLIADDAALSTNVTFVTGELVSGKAVFNTSFLGTKYFTVIGKVVATPCVQCVGGTFPVKAGKEWNPLAKRQSNNNGTYAVGTDANGNAITANNTITYATPGNEYVPQFYPAPYGNGAIMGRYDNTNGAAGKATYTTTLNYAAAIDFQINGISTWYGNKVKVVIKGECNGELINPKISPVVTGYLAAYNSYKITGNEVLGNKYYQGFNNFSAVKVAFAKPVSKVIVEWTIERSPTYVTGYWLWIQDFSLKCLAPPTPNVDKVYAEQMFTKNNVPTCSEAEMKITIDNANCDPKTITGFTNTLPPGIEYVVDSFSSSDITSVSPTYSAGNFTLPNFVAPAGKSVFYIKVKPTNTAAATATYQTQSSYAIQGSTAGTFLSDNADGVAGVQKSDLTFTAATALPVPLITLTSDKEPGSCGIINYTATINNNTGAALTGYEFTTNLNPGQTLVGSSILVAGGAAGTTQPSAYAGEGNFLISGLNIPTGIHTITFQTDAAVASENQINEVSIAADPADECSLSSKKTASLPVKTCVACVGGKAKLVAGSTWKNAGTSAKTSNALSNIVVGTPQSGQLRADVTVTYPNATTEWRPNAFPRQHGKWVEMSRYDNLNGATGLVKYVVNLKDANGVSVAAKPSFQVAGMSKIYGQTDVVTIKGYCGAEEVKPILKYNNNYFPNIYNRFSITNNVATGTKPYYDNWTYATTNVEFEKVVERIEIEWIVNRTPAYKTLGFLYVGDMKFACDNPIEPNPDNVSLTASYIADELPTCEEGSIKLLINNSNCATKTINVTNSLPASLQYVADSYSGIAAETPTYSGQSFSLNGLAVPAGKSYVYVKVKPNNVASSGTFDTLYNYTVDGGASATHRSDDDSGTSGFQDTGITYTASTPVVKPVIVKSVDKCFKTNTAGTGTELTYTLTVNNPTASAITNVDLMDILDGDQAYVASSLVNPFGGTANDYATDKSILNVSGMTIPANTVNGIITIKALTQSTNVDIKNVAVMTVDLESACGSAGTANSNELDILRCVFCTQNPNTTVATEFSGTGITTQVKRSGWPENIPNGFMVLESKDKGFVLTRLTTAQRDNASFTAVEGMLIYNTTENCTQLYNGTGWKCIERDCNN